MKINLILLAAGNSSRFGTNKLLYEIDGTPMYRHVIQVIESLPKSIFSKKIIVSQYEPILMDKDIKKSFTMVKNPDSSRGISSSIHLGMEHSQEDADAWCFMVCDQPYMTKDTISNFVRSFMDSEKPLACVAYHNKWGNPTIFSNIFQRELMELSGDQGGKCIMEKYIQDVCCYQVANPKELMDIDEPF
ncbi:MAG: nucleotidyltransferase family protein [Lachnospiraceae bacterium]